jgi:hypothetical protein
MGLMKIKKKIKRQIVIQGIHRAVFVTMTAKGCWFKLRYSHGGKVFLPWHIMMESIKEELFECLPKIDDSIPIPQPIVRQQQQIELKKRNGSLMT